MIAHSLEQVRLTHSLSMQARNRILSGRFNLKAYVSLTLSVSIAVTSDGSSKLKSCFSIGRQLEGKG